MKLKIVLIISLLVVLLSQVESARKVLRSNKVESSRVESQALENEEEAEHNNEVGSDDKDCTVQCNKLCGSNSKFLKVNNSAKGKLSCTCKKSETSAIFVQVSTTHSVTSVTASSFACKKD